MANEENIYKNGTEGTKRLPSVEQPWLKHFKEQPDDKKNTETVYEALKKRCEKNPNLLAIEYFGMKMNYSQLLQKVEETAKAFKANGIKEGDFVTICAAGIPETVYAFYALSKIGAVSNMISPYFNHDQLVDRIKECDSDMLIVMDTFYDDIKPAIDRSQIKKTVVLPSVNSSLLRFIKKPHKLDKTKNEIYWNDFVKEGRTIDKVEACTFKEQQPVAMVYSSGTTGASKGILLTNDSFQNSIEAYRKTGIDLSPGQKFYQIVPTWFSTGLSTSVNLPLVNGISLFMDPRFKRDLFIKNIVKHKPNYTVAPTGLYEGFLDEKLVGNHDLSFLHYPFEGGEPLFKETRNRIEKVLKEHGNKSSLKVGYGQCECGAGVSTEIHNQEHPEGTVGIPLAGITIGVFDDDRNELGYNQCGEILVDTPCCMKEYYKNEEATSEFFYIDENGKRWCCTGDVGHIDEDGYLYIDGRATDFTIVGDKKVYNFEVESAIGNNSEDIVGLDVVEKLDADSENKMAVHIIPSAEFKERMLSDPKALYDKLDEIQQNIYRHFGDESLVPTIFKIRDDFPWAASGKRDVEGMKHETEGFIEQPFQIQNNKVYEKK